MTLVEVRWTRIGFHNWPDAPASRDYLSSPHRHLFYFSAALSVDHDDREVEFHDLLDVVSNATPPDNAHWGHTSCEMMAKQILTAMRLKYGYGRVMQVRVFEDNEVGAEVTLREGEGV